MKTGRDFLCGRCVNPPLALDPRKTGEACRDDTNPKVGLAAFPGTGMAGMTRAFVFDQKLNRRESRFEFLTQAFLNGT